MITIGKSLFLAIVSLFNRRMVWLMMWPVMAALAFWGALGLVFWVKTATWIAGQLARLAEPVTAYIPFEFGGVTLFSAHVMMMLLFVPLVYLTALIILGAVGMDKMVDHVASRHYPDLLRKHGGGTAGSVWNGVVALCGMVLLFLVTLPLLLIPPLWAIVPVAVMAWVNQKILRYDAVADHASPQEMNALFSTRRSSLYLLGLALALVAYIPIVGFFSPMLFGLAFIHFGLGSLRDLRESATGKAATRRPAGGHVIEGEVIREPVSPSDRLDPQR
jgi:CysZ protein